LLRYDPVEGRFMAGENNPLNCDLLIIDEASMLDVRLAASLFRAVPATAHVILVGDVNQLPSIGAGHVLHDLIHCGKTHVTRLEKIFRQQEQSAIVTTAHAILKGRASPPPISSGLGDLDPAADLHFIQTGSPESCVQTIVDLCRHFIPEHYSVDPVMDVQALAPMHKGSAGISSLNSAMQDALNPTGNGLNAGVFTYRTGDKVIQTRNNYEKNIFNGDLGKITYVNSESGTLAATFDRREIDFEKNELTHLQLAYTTSVHKAQGSEFPIVIIALLKQHFIMLQRNLLYTAITRGKRKVFIVGEPEAYTIAVNNRDSTIRLTDLARKISTGD